MNITFLGYGQVGAPLADHLQRAGHRVSLAARDPASPAVQQALARNPQLTVRAPREAILTAEVVFLATPFEATQELLRAFAAQLTGKILIDCTNPVGPGLSHGLGNAESGSERLQQCAPGARVVKAFSISDSRISRTTRIPRMTSDPRCCFVAMTAPPNNWPPV